jgi:hypothetical protein
MARGTGYALRRMIGSVAKRQFTAVVEQMLEDGERDAQ